MTLVSLIFLFVYLFGAYAYGAATVYSVRNLSPVWGGSPDSSGRRHRIDLALFALSTVWFALHILIEFQNFTGMTGDSWLELGMLMLVFLFPPVIMHTVYVESLCEGSIT